MSHTAQQGAGKSRRSADADSRDVAEICSIAATVDIIGDRWSLLIPRGLWGTAGAGGPMP